MDNISEKIYNKAVRAASKIGEASMQLMLDMQEAIIKILENKDVEGEVSAKEMLKYAERGGILKNITIPDANASKIKEALKKYNVSFASLDLTNDEKKLIIFKEKDAERVAAILTELNVNKGLVTEIGLNDFLSYTKEQDLVQFENVKNVDLELVRYYAKEVNMPFAVMENDNHSNIYINKNDYNKLQYCMTATAWTLAGPNGSSLRKDIGQFYNNKKEIFKALHQMTDRCFIVDKNGKNSLEVTPFGISYVKNGNLVKTIDINDENYKEEAAKLVNGMNSPAVLSPEEMNSDNKMKLIQERGAMNVTGIMLNNTVKPMTLRALTYDNVQAIAEKLKEKGVNFTVSKDKRDSRYFTLSFDSRYKEEYKELLKDFEQDKEMFYKVQGKGDLYVNLNEYTKDKYIVDLENNKNILMIKETGVYLLNEKGLQKVQEKDYDKLMEEFKKPLAVDKEVFEKLMDKSDGIDIDLKKEVVTDSEERLIKNTEREEELFAQKVSIMMDNDIYHAEPQKPEQSFEDFKIDVDNGRKEEMHQSQKAADIYKDYKVSQMVDQGPRTIDSIIERNKAKVDRDHEVETTTKTTVVER